MSEDDSKTEEPTPKKLEKTKEEGQFARSQDLSVAVLTIGAVSYNNLTLPTICRLSCVSGAVVTQSHN